MKEINTTITEEAPTTEAPTTTHPISDSDLKIAKLIRAEFESFTNQLVRNAAERRNRYRKATEATFAALLEELSWSDTYAEDLVKGQMAEGLLYHVQVLKTRELEWTYAQRVRYAVNWAAAEAKRALLSNRFRPTSTSVGHNAVEMGRAAATAWMYRELSRLENRFEDMSRI